MSAHTQQDARKIGEPLETVTTSFPSYDSAMTTKGAKTVRPRMKPEMASRLDGAGIESKNLAQEKAIE